MKTIITTTVFLIFSQLLLAQCPTTGRDSSAVYCKNELFDLADLLSSDASANGLFIDFSGDTMTSSSLFLPFPGQFPFYYKVSDTGCPVDSAKFTINIHNCWTGGIAELGYENNNLIYPNPVTDKITLNVAQPDHLVIYSTAGYPVFTRSKPFGPTLDLSHLKQGAYVLVVDKNGERQFRRFIKN
ncbi:hypothetical protein D3C87_14630 [compost metagenome]